MEWFIGPDYQGEIGLLLHNGAQRALSGTQEILWEVLLSTSMSNHKG